VDRRRFLLTSLAGTLAAPLAARAQQAGKVYRIGFLSPNSPTATAPYSEAFRQGLRELGWIEGQNIVIEYRFADGTFARLPDLAGQFVAAGVDVIVATFNPAIIAAAKATTTTPIVALIVLQPVETGIVKSLARPGGNVTGLSWEDGTEQVTKKLEIFKEIAPTASSMAAVWNPTVPGLARYWEPFKTSATALGMAVSPVEYSDAPGLDRAMNTIQRARPSGVFFWGDPLASVRRQSLCEFALKNRLPTLGPGGHLHGGRLFNFVCPQH
jgi:putative tryptophan/tyrosine transport system substrate-binding protein